MKITIMAKNGYRVRRVTHALWVVLDGKIPVLYCQRVSMEEYREMLKCTSGDGYKICDCFETVEGEKYIYFTDNDFDIDYIVKIEEAN